MNLDSPANAFVEAACVPVDGSWHGAGTLDEAEAILREHPEVARSSIFTAAILGDEATVRSSIERDATAATAKGGLYGWDPLTYLCFSRYLRLDRSRSEAFVRTARLLLEGGASANTGFWSKDHAPEAALETVLYGAAGIAHHAAMTRLLLEHGADPNDGETAYHAPEGRDDEALYALVESGKVGRASLTTMLGRKLDWHDYDAVVWLLDHGADPNELSAWGKAALHHALERDNPVRFFELFLDRGADPRLESRSGRTAVAIAARMGRGDVLELFERRNLSIELEGGDALLAACARADERAARAILAREPVLVASLEAEDRSFVADFAGAGNTAAVRLMLDLGFDVGSRTSKGGSSDDTALHLAIWRGRHETVKLLVERGAPLEALNEQRRTPLAHAVRAVRCSEWLPKRGVETVALLLGAGARVDTVELPTGSDELDALLRRPA